MVAVLLVHEVANTASQPVRTAGWVEDANPLLYSRDDVQFGLDETVFQLVVLVEADPGAQERSEWLHELCELAIVGDLVDQAEPGTNVRNVRGPGKVPDGVNVLGQRLDHFRR